MNFLPAAMLDRVRAAVHGARRLRIVLRQSPDWRHAPRHELIAGSRAFCRAVNKPTGLREDFISDVIEVWDRTFALSFFEVRALMKDIARDNLAAVRDATLVPLAAANGNSAADLHLFIDDDDWLHPRLYREIQSHLNEADGYIFGNILCTSRIELRRIEDGCYTNNYAVAARFMRKLDGRCEPVAQHWDANEAFHQPDFRRCYVPLYVSATNKHPASAMKLKDGMQENALSAATLRLLVEKFVDESADTELPPPAAWAAPHIRRVRQVFAKLI